MRSRESASSSIRTRRVKLTFSLFASSVFLPTVFFFFHRSLTYRQLKHSAEDYQQAKKVLRRGETAVFRAWVGAGEEWERFGVDGRQVDLVESQEDR